MHEDYCDRICDITGLNTDTKLHKGRWFYGCSPEGICLTQPEEEWKYYSAGKEKVDWDTAKKKVQHDDRFDHVRR